jgi:prepilin-type processing-associated H-X9-DG protein
MNKFRLALSLLVAAGAAVFALRHHSLRQLQAEHAQLEHRSEEASNRAAVIPPTPIAESPTNAVLSAAERSELLRLRGQIGPLRVELAQATNELALSRPTRAASSGAPEEPVVSKAEATQKFSAGKQWMIALITYAQSHQQQLPATLAEAMPFAGQAQIQGAEFEFVRTNLDLTSIKSPATTIVLRETKSWKSYNGKWNRAYAFADGHVENAVTDTNDFTDWEAKHQPAEDQSVR